MVYGIKKSFSRGGLSFWQSENWKNLLGTTKYAKEVFYYGKEDGTYLLIEIRSLGYGFFGAFALGVRAVQIRDDFPEFQVNLIKFLGDKGVLFLQIEPMEEIPLFSKYPVGAYKKFLTPYTRTLDLNKPLEELLSGMHEKGRYNIRLAEKRGVRIEEVSPSKENLDTWMRLVSETTLRDGFSGNSREYYETFLFLEGVKMLFAYYENRVIAAGIFVFREDMAIYYYGVSSGEKEDRKHMAPYLLQWHAITIAKAKNIALYDFLGVSDPHNPRDPLGGVSQFKEKFGGDIVKLPQKHIFFVSIKGKIFFFLKKLQQKIFH